MKRIFEVGQAGGACWGVERAMNSAFGVRRMVDRNGGGEVVVLGRLVHNDDAIAELTKKGVGEIKHDYEGAGKHVIITAHGLDPRIMARVGKVALSVNDQTCPIVRLQHEAALELKGQNRKMVLIGKQKPHPEVDGTKGVLKGKVVVIEDVTQVRSIPYDFDDPIGVVAQTTFDPLKVGTILTVMRESFRNVVYIKTTCSDITSKLVEIRERAIFSDLVIVLSGHDSENGNNMRETAVSLGKQTIFIPNQEKLVECSLQGSSRIFLTAAASTLNPQIEAVKGKLKTWGWEEVEPPGPKMTKEERAKRTAGQAAGRFF